MHRVAAVDRAKDSEDVDSKSCINPVASVHEEKASNGPPVTHQSPSFIASLRTLIDNDIPVQPPEPAPLVTTASHSVLCPEEGDTDPEVPPLMPNLAKEYLDRLKDRQEVEDEDDDFQPIKKHRKVVETNYDDLEMQTCSICFEPWSNSGSHRIASLRCGHLFGLLCIEKWLKNARGGKCPQCNCKAKKGDIRVIFAKAVSVLDTTEKDRALKTLEEEKQLCIQAKRGEAQALLGQNLARSECDKLKEEIERLKAKLNTFASSSETNAESCGTLSSSTVPSAMEEESVAVRAEGKYTVLKNIHVSQNSSARVMAYDAHNQMLAVSKLSSDPSRPGNGLDKLSTVDLRHSEYVGIHSGLGTIRDMSFRPRGDGVLLTAATDKTAKLTSLQSNTTVQNFDLASPVWACGWDQDDPNYLYCGLQSGSVVVYDVRAPSEQVGCLMRSDGGKCPITSLAAVPRNVSSSLNCGGLLMGSLGGCMFWEKLNSSGTDFKPHPLRSLPEGPCPSVSFEPSTQHCFSSFRPTRRAPRGKHILFQLHNVPTHKPLSCQPIQQFLGGSTHRLLSRSNLFLHPESEDRLLAAYGDEGMKTVHICDISSTLELQVLPLVREPALDMVPFGDGEQSQYRHLAILTQSKLHIYAWT